MHITFIFEDIFADVLIFFKIKNTKNILKFAKLKNIAFVE